MFDLQGFINGFMDKEPVDTVTPVEGISPDINPFIQKVLASHTVRLDIEPEAAQTNALAFATYVGQVENDGETYGRNVSEVGAVGSSASGLYQFLTDNSKGQSALQTAVNRTRKYTGETDWLKDAFDTGEVEGLTRNQQTALFLGDILEQDGSDELMKPILEGDRSRWKEAYLKLHYKETKDKPATEATIKRADDIYKMFNIEVQF